MHDDHHCATAKDQKFPEPLDRGEWVCVWLIGLSLVGIGMCIGATL